MSSSDGGRQWRGVGSGRHPHTVGSRARSRSPLTRGDPSHEPSPPSRKRARHAWGHADEPHYRPHVLEEQGRPAHYQHHLQGDDGRGVYEHAVRRWPEEQGRRWAEARDERWTRHDAGGRGWRTGPAAASDAEIPPRREEEWRGGERRLRLHSPPSRPPGAREHETLGRAHHHKQYRETPRHRGRGGGWEHRNEGGRGGGSIGCRGGGRGGGGDRDCWMLTSRLQSLKNPDEVFKCWSSSTLISLSLSLAFSLSLSLSVTHAQVLEFVYPHLSLSLACSLARSRSL